MMELLSDKTILAAVIGAIAVIIAALLTAYFNRKSNNKKPKETVNKFEVGDIDGDNNSYIIE